MSWVRVCVVGIALVVPGRAGERPWKRIVSGSFICLGKNETERENNLGGRMTEKGGKRNDDKKEAVFGNEKECPYHI